MRVRRYARLRRGRAEVPRRVIRASGAVNYFGRSGVHLMDVRASIQRTITRPFDGWLRGLGEGNGIVIVTSVRDLEMFMFDMTNNSS